MALWKHVKIAKPRYGCLGPVESKSQRQETSYTDKKWDFGERFRGLAQDKLPLLAWLQISLDSYNLRRKKTKIHN